MIKSPYHGQTCEVKSPSYALDCSTAFCLTSLRAFMKFARSNLLLFDEGIAYPLIQPDYNLDIFFWALWFACKGKTWGISHIACKISSALSVLYLWYEGKFSKTKIIRFLPGLQLIFVCSLYRLLKTYPSTIINIFEHRIDSRRIIHFFFFEFFRQQAKNTRVWYRKKALEFSYRPNYVLRPYMYPRMH